MNIDEFDYHLPPELIAQSPIEHRDQSKLLVLNRANQSMEHDRFFNVTDYVNKGDILIFNDSRVIPARLTGIKADSNTKVELLLLRQFSDTIWETLARPGKKLKTGTEIIFTDNLNKKTMSAIIKSCGFGGIRIVQFSDGSLPEAFGKVPLPPYIRKNLDDPERYQTVYSDIKGSAAAPTAGLHFTPEILDALKNKGVQLAFVTLHIGLDTFQPVRVNDPRNHTIHTEYGRINVEVTELINQAKRDNNRIIAVGTSTVRLIEAASQVGEVQPFTGQVNLFILPGYRFHSIDAMITNFHLPRSTLIMMVSAFAGKEFIFEAYNEAIKQQYRFYSFGDAMLIL